MTAVLIHGDCRVLMADMAEASVDAIATDPPYELGFMGKSWDSSGIANDVEMWKAALRVLKPGGHLAAFSHSRTYHRMACAIEDAGFEIRDQIMWIYGSGFPKAGNMKPAHEPIVLARKPFSGSRAACVAAHGTGGLNIEACRIESERLTGWAGAGGNTWNNSNMGLGKDGDARPVAGRYPANLVHDGSDAVVAEFPTTTSGVGAIKRASGSDACGNQGAAYGAESRPAGTEMVCYGDTGSAARFFYCAKASKSDRDEGLGHLDEQRIVTFQTGNGASGAASSISEGRETQYRNTHPTVKPEGLMRWLCRLITPAGGTILDPFTGSGSTGKAAVLEGFGFIGCELTAEYIPIAEARIAAAEARACADTDHTQGSLFGAAA